MKNPCDDCIVRPMCSEVCPEKINYGNLLSQAVNEHQSRFFTKEGKFNLEYKKSYIHWRSLFARHREQLESIFTVARDIKKIK